jgi:two-component system OmpR family sensor kinase
MIYNLLEVENLDTLKLSEFLNMPIDSALRVSIIDLKGNVIFDNAAQNDEMDNHLNRAEIQEAKEKGQGSSIRLSGTTKEKYFYKATRFDDFFVRTALPYDLKLKTSLSADSIFLYFLIIFFSLAVLGLKYMSSKLGKTISSLRNFALKAGAEEPIRENIKFPNDELGEIGSYIVQIYNNLKKTRDKLYIEREKLDKHIQTSNEGLAFFSREKKEILANEHFIQYINVISDKKGENSEYIFSIPEFELLNAFIDENLAKKSDKVKMLKESILLYKNGKTFTVKSIVFQDKSFEISINNITQQEEENRLKKQLTQNIAHELRTPVSSIQGYLETILNNPDLEETKKQFFIERSYSQAIRLSSLVSDISMLNKMDESADLFDHDCVDILKLVNSVVSDLSLQTEEKNIVFKINIDPNVVINGNRSLLYSIFRNLADNSLAYAGENIEIYITCFREDKEFYYFSYYDTGVGVPEQHLNRLFDRFYRIDQGRSRKLGGTGLGLSIVKNAVLFHKGQIVAKNRAGGGLEFIFTLMKDKNSKDSF